MIHFSFLLHYSPFQVWSFYFALLCCVVFRFVLFIRKKQIISCFELEVVWCCCLNSQKYPLQFTGQTRQKSGNCRNRALKSNRKREREREKPMTTSRRVLVSWLVWFSLLSLFRVGGYLALKRAKRQLWREPKQSTCVLNAKRAKLINALKFVAQQTTTALYTDIQRFVSFSLWITEWTCELTELYCFIKLKEASRCFLLYSLLHSIS